MNRFQSFRLRIRALFRKETLDARMDEEMRSHIEMQTRENIEAGMNPGEARFAALRQFGWTESIKETCREQRGVAGLENFARDIRHGARQLRKSGRDGGDYPPSLPHHRTCGFLASGVESKLS